jgi:TRAP-type C4-dicarboxylate transport system substrate-binding protein
VIQEAYESRFNVKHFPAIISMQYALATTKPINSLDDVKGLKLRALGVYGEFAQKLGASATVIPGAELYTALQLGTVDGLIYDAEAMIATGLEEFLKTTVIHPNLNAGAGHWLINRDKWNELPPDLQKVIADAAQYGNIASAMSYRATAEENVGIMRKKGVQMLSLSAAEMAKANDVAHELWDEVAARTPGAAKGVEIVKQQMRDYGRLK